MHIIMVQYVHMICTYLQFALLTVVNSPKWSRCEVIGLIVFHFCFELHDKVFSPHLFSHGYRGNMINVLYRTAIHYRRWWVDHSWRPLKVWISFCDMLLYHLCCVRMLVYLAKNLELMLTINTEKMYQTHSRDETFGEYLHLYCLLSLYPSLQWYGVEVWFQCLMSSDAGCSC